jgi:hypothetical protein
MQLSRTNITGKAIGRVRLVFDSITVDAPGHSGVLHLSIEAIPDPINLDNLSFTLIFDRDVAVLSPQAPDCALGNPLCDYTVTYSGDPENGSIRFDLTRTDLSRTQSLSGGKARIDIPFITFLAKNASTTVIAENLNVSQSSEITSDTGLITVGTDGCGFDVLRGFLRNGVIAVTSIAPNPSSSDISVNVVAEYSLASTLSIYNANGNVVLKHQVGLLQGENMIGLRHNLPAGSYSLVLATTGGSATTMFVVQR